MSDRLTAVQEILLGAADIDRSGGKEFSEWDLTVATWKRNPNRFGCRGYEDNYPDHKRIMMEIMATAKKDNPLRRGWFERTRANHYRLTDIGRDAANQLADRNPEPGQSQRSPQPIYDAVSPLYRNPVFRKYIIDPEEPRMWLGAASFLGLTSNEPQHVEDRRRAVRTAIGNALTWLDATKSETIRSGVTGGEQGISRESLLKLKEFLAVIEKRYERQIAAIQKAKR